MKRNINLQKLSKDHHHGLLLGWKIREGLKRGVQAEVIADYVHYFSKEALIPHFREEEEILLPFLQPNNEVKLKILEEHRIISERLETLGTQQELLDLAQILDSHIRFEERIVFPYLEQCLTDAQLEQIGQSISETEGQFVDTYPNEFWKHSN